MWHSFSNGWENHFENIYSAFITFYNFNIIFKMTQKYDFQNDLHLPRVFAVII